MESLVLYFFILQVFVFYIAKYISLLLSSLFNCCKSNAVPIQGIFCIILMNLTDPEVETFFETNA